MALYYGVGNIVVPEEEYLEKLRTGAFRKAQHSVDIAGRAVRLTEVASLTSKLFTKQDFTAIEYGKPLTAEIRWVYTGEYPHASWLQKAKDVIVTSAFKSIATFNEAPRNINLLQQNIKTQTDLQWTAVDQGSPIVFYTPAVAETATYATFEIAFDNFPDDLIKKFGDAASSAAGVPLFAAASTYLLVAGALLKLVASTGKTLFDGVPAFKATQTITFARPGDDPTPAGWLIVDQASAGDDVLRGLTVGKGGQLFDPDGNAYRGDYPYMVISLDGATRQEYESFTPTAASAALLEKFFRTKDRDTQLLQNLQDALKIFNDYTFFSKAKKLEDQIAKLKAKNSNDPDLPILTKEFEAAKKNIMDDLLKLP